MNTRPILMTGDSQRMAKTFARQLSLEEFKAGIHAGDKTREIQLLQAHGHNVALIDKADVNIPSARQADLTIVPATGEPRIKRFAGIVLTEDGLGALPHCLALSRRAMETIRSNYIWAFAGPLLALPAAGGLLYAFGGPLFAPWMASLAALPGVAAAIINAFRLRRV